MSTAPTSASDAPWILYGTAWKEGRTEALTTLALEQGFRGIDTANQRKHYFEAGVGAAIAASGIDRDALFLQTKFTYERGQDHRLPYDSEADFATQVHQSFASSLDHLGTDRIDSLVLHGPWAAKGWSDPDREVWSAMRELRDGGRVRFLGVSNLTAAQLRALCDAEGEAPVFVQNRCYARRGWDREMRAACAELGVRYQGFSLLTANASELSSRSVRAIARRLGATVPQVVFRFAVALGMIPLTGTSSAKHMREDLAALDLELTDSDLATLERVSR